MAESLSDVDGRCGHPGCSGACRRKAHGRPSRRGLDSRAADAVVFQATAIDELTVSRRQRDIAPALQELALLRVFPGMR
jgi:hypothetical protein